MGGVLLSPRVLALGLLSLAWGGTAWALPCPDRAAQLDTLQASVVTADFANVPDQLEAATEAFGCGAKATPDQLAALWIAEGAYLALTGESVAAIDSFSAARRVAPDGWIEAYGGSLRKAWEVAPQPSTVGRIDVDPRPQWWTVFVDGVPVDSLPLEAGTGLHVVQVGPDAADIRMGKVVFLRPGSTAVAAHSLEEGAPPVPKAVTPEAPPPPELPSLPMLSAHVAAGAGVAVGRSEPGSSAAQIAVPLEWGVLYRRGGLWGRLGASSALRIGSQWAYSDARGDALTPTALGTQLAVGGRTAQGDVGALVGLQWPGRVALRALVAVPLGESPFYAEGRLGTNILAGAEPAVELLLAVRPALWR